MINQENEDTVEIREGDKPFNFEFQNNNGERFELKELLGKKKLVIYFYPKDFTPGCTIEAEEFSSDYPMFKKNNIEIIGISPDSKETHTRFREKMNIPYMLASDSDNTISKQYGVYGLKKFMGKEYQGVSRSTFLVDQHGVISKVFKNVKPKGHTKEVLEFFNQS